MTNTTESQWETALLNKIASNGERIAVVEREIENVNKNVSNNGEKLERLETRLTGVETRLTGIEDLINTVKSWLKLIGGILGALTLGVIGNFLYTVINRG